jgi:hypothetical protein
MPAAEPVRGRRAADGLVALLLFTAIAVYLSLLARKDDGRDSPPPVGS